MNEAVECAFGLQLAAGVSGVCSGAGLTPLCLTTPRKETSSQVDSQSAAGRFTAPRNHD